MTTTVQVGENLFHKSCAPDGESGVIVTDFGESEVCANCGGDLAEDPPEDDEAAAS